MDNQGALEGIRVLDLSRMLPGPYCTMILADHGARVITIEDRRFALENSFPTIVNRNKEHMTLNLKTDKGKEIFYRLAEKADIVVEGFKPGTAAKLGIDYETLKNKNPGLIYCAITGYGQTGPLKNRPGHDINYIGVSGLLDLIGNRKGPPSIPGFQVADIAGGAMHAVTGILLALAARARTGWGQVIDISMTDCCFPMHAVNLNLHQLTQETPKRSDAFLSHGYGFYNTYETRDNRALTIGAVEPRFWKALCDHLGLAEFSNRQLDPETGDTIIERLREIFKTKTLGEWEKELEQVPTCWAPVKTMTEALASDLFSEREMVVDLVDENQNPVKTFGIPIKMSSTPGSIRSGPVKFGESTAGILKELGMDKAEIKILLDNKVI